MNAFIYWKYFIYILKILFNENWVKFEMLQIKNLLEDWNTIISEVMYTISRSLILSSFSNLPFEGSNDEK